MNKSKSILLIALFIALTWFVFLGCTKPEKVSPLYQEEDSLVWVEYYNQVELDSLNQVFLIELETRDYIVKRKSPGIISVVKFYER